ncbi:hypothetical protein [Sinomonas sp.]
MDPIAPVAFGQQSIPLEAGLCPVGPGALSGQALRGLGCGQLRLLTHAR